MSVSNSSSIWWAKKKFKLRKNLTWLKKLASTSLASAVRSLWSVRGAAGLALIIIVFNVGQLLVTTWGKLVVLPFEIRSDQTLPPDFGSAFAGSLVARLNDFRMLFPPTDAGRRVEIDQNDNTFDIIQSFLADLPLVNIPRLSPLNKGSMALESFKVGPFSIPIGQILFENFVFFHKDTLRGAIELIGDQIIAHLSLEPDQTIIISVPKDQGYRSLIDRISVELLERKNWISPVPMTPAALQSFTMGLEAYRNYSRFGEESFLIAARQRYQEAVNADHNADLARLHLAARQYISWDDDVLRRAVSNFSALRGSAGFERQARIGHVAAELRLIERSKGCNRKYQFLESALREVDSWTDFKFEDVVVQANVYRAAATYILPNNECSEVLSRLLRNETFDGLTGKAEQKYATALKILASDDKFSASQKRRYSLAIQIQKKYILNDRTDFAILNKESDDEIFAKAAVQAGLELARDKDELPAVQKRFFPPFLSGSNAESYLRLAKTTRDRPAAQMELVDEAVALLRKTIAEGDEQAAQWALLRIADIELSRNNTHEGLEWISAFFNLASGSTTSFLTLVDERAFAAGILIEKPQTRCQAIAMFKKADVPYSIFGRLITGDAFRRARSLNMAAQRLTDMHDVSVSATQWLGPVIPEKIALVRAKFDAMNGNKQSASDVLTKFKTEMPIYSNNPMLLVDAYELAAVLGRTEYLTQLERVIKLPSIREVLLTGRGAEPDCTKTAG